MSQKPTYFLAPPRPFPPSGPIRLGAIISSPTLPDEPLHLPPLPSSTDISTFTEKNWTATHIRQTSTRLGIWTSFLQMILSVGADINVQLDRSAQQTWDISSMRTQAFHPSDAFLRDVVAAPEVRAYVAGNRFREKIFMVTGVMVAGGGSREARERLEERGVYVHAGVDATAWAGVPISVGPEGRWVRREGVRTESVREEEFVFAFRVREVRVGRKGGVKSHKAYTDKGALFNTERKKEVREEEEVELEGLGEEPDGEDFGLELSEARQEGDEEEEECICVLPEEL